MLYLLSFSASASSIPMNAFLFSGVLRRHHLHLQRSEHSPSLLCLSKVLIFHCNIVTFRLKWFFMRFSSDRHAAQNFWKAFRRPDLQYLFLYPLLWAFTKLVRVSENPANRSFWRPVLHCPTAERCISVRDGVTLRTSFTKQQPCSFAIELWCGTRSI